MTLARFSFLAMVASAFAPETAAAQAAPKIEVSRQGDSYNIRVEALLSAPAKHVWSTLTDCGSATKFIPHLESCRILEKDPAGRWDIRENVANPPVLTRIRTIVRNDYTPGGFSYRLVSGDMRVSEGSWRVTPKGDASSVLYVARVEPSLPVPGFLVIGAIKADLPALFSNLESLSREAAARSGGNAANAR